MNRVTSRSRTKQPTPRAPKPAPDPMLADILAHIVGSTPDYVHAAWQTYRGDYNSRLAAMKASHLAQVEA